MDAENSPGMPALLLVTLGIPSGKPRAASMGGP
jgi:hypothetical protein